MRRWQYWIAQFGSTESREFSRSLLLEAESLPRQPWQLKRQRIRRTGIFGESSERSNRARQIGSFTVTNYFRSVSSDREMWIQAVPYASASDAEAEVPHHHLTFHANRRKNISIVDSHAIPLGDAINGKASWSAELLNNVGGQLVTQKILISSISKVLFVVSSSALEEEFGLNWSDMAYVAQMQSVRIANTPICRIG
jgi:hypothetical protein